jgi:hypothetical protein
MVVLNTFGSSLWNLLHDTLLGPTVSRWLSRFLENVFTNVTGIEKINRS